MSFPRERDPVPDLTTTRIGGGGRAWLVALGAVVVLGSVIYLGLSGRSAGPTGSHAPAASSLVAAATPAQSAGSTPDLSQVESIRSDPTAPVLYQYLGSGLVLNGNETLAVLDPVAPDVFRGMYRIPYPLVTPTADLELATVNSSVSNDDLERLGIWTFPLNSIHPGAGPSVVVLDMFEPAQGNSLGNPDFDRLATNGYRITVTTQDQADAGLMTVDVETNPDQFVPNENYAIDAGPSGTRFNVQLEQASPVTWVGQAEIPSGLDGRIVPVTLSAVPVSAPTDGRVDVGTWWIGVPAKPRSGKLNQVQVNQDGRPIAAGEPQMLNNGFDMNIDEALVSGRLNLRIVLTVRPTSGAADSLPATTR